MAGQTCDGTVVGQAPIKSRPLAAPLVDAPVRGQILGKATYTCQAVHGSHGRERDPYILTGSSERKPGSFSANPTVPLRIRSDI